MIAESIPLRFAGRGRIARLREMTGRDEYSVVGTGTDSAIRLLTALLDSNASKGSAELKAADLVAADRDCLLAAVYKRAFGDRIESTVNCGQCHQPFDLDFSLDRLIASVTDAKADRSCKALGDGLFEAMNGLKFRLPTGSDELAGAALPMGEAETFLLRCCTPQGTWREGQADFEELLEQVAPLIDLELIAPCPECNHAHIIHFDIQTYLLGSLVAERHRLLTEINKIARSYSWSLTEILSLSRSDRRQFVELIQNDYVT
jgi:hypothetical protein